MKKLLAAALLFAAVSTASAGTIATFELKGFVASSAGYYDDNGTWVSSSVVIFRSYDGGTESNRVYCPAAGCGPVGGGNCVDAIGELHSFDSATPLEVTSFTILQRADCY